MSDPFPDPRTLLKRYGLRAKKSWGQNFLIAGRVYRAIVDATVVGNADWVVEVGAGLGTLTMRLAERVPEGKVVAVERDRDMVDVLEKELSHLDNVEVHAANAMEYDFSAISKWCGERIAVCGNLPYQIAAPILFHALAQSEHISHLVVMLQREMADRLIAQPGTKQYGALTALMASRATARVVIQAKPTDFAPPPKVSSTVVRLDLSPTPRLPIADESTFRAVVNASFAQRRKTLRNALRAAFPAEVVDAALEARELDGTRRGETLSPTEFAELAAEFPTDLVRN